MFRPPQYDSLPKSNTAPSLVARRYPMPLSLAGEHGFCGTKSGSAIPVRSAFALHSGQAGGLDAAGAVGNGYATSFAGTFGPPQAK